MQLLYEYFPKIFGKVLAFRLLHFSEQAVNDLILRLLHIQIGIEPQIEITITPVKTKSRAKYPEHPHHNRELLAPEQWKPYEISIYGRQVPK